MKRTLMMLVAALVMATVASVQAADVKIELKERDAKQNLVPAQNVKYSVANGEGKIVADGSAAEFAMDVAEGNYELTVEQTLPNDHVRYGAATFAVPTEGAEYAYEITDAGLVLIEEDDDDKAALVIPNKPVMGATAKPIAALPQVPAQVPTTAVTSGGNNWGILGLAGALVATAIALGVDDDECPCPVSPCQR
ncbi:MAG: hypothetical protein IJZ10_12080 [Thermoguttaceae bacterium]|nr:hypothetical protein [Thermoguttaceae bacterium]